MDLQIKKEKLTYRFVRNFVKICALFLLLSNNSVFADEVKSFTSREEQSKCANPFYGFNQLLLAALGSDQKYESEIIKLLDAVPEDARDGVFMACEALNTPAICRKLMEKFTLWIKTDPDYGIATGEGGYLEKFIALWQKTQNDKSVDEFIVFCRNNWCGWEEK